MEVGQEPEEEWEEEVAGEECKAPNPDQVPGENACALPVELPHPIRQGYPAIKWNAPSAAIP